MRAQKLLQEPSSKLDVFQPHLLEVNVDCTVEDLFEAGVRAIAEMYVGHFQTHLVFSTEWRAREAHVRIEEHTRFPATYIPPSGLYVSRHVLPSGKGAMFRGLD